MPNHTGEGRDPGPESEAEHHASGVSSGFGKYAMTPRLAQFATSPGASLLQLLVTGVALPLIALIGGRSLSQLDDLVKATQRIEIANATMENRTRALETLGAAQAEAIGGLREKAIRHEYLIERVQDQVAQIRGSDPAPPRRNGVK
jgi:uncharacterized protein HemX